MIHFDKQNISIEIVQLKFITQALGGSISVVDSIDSKGREVYKRMPVPLAVARAFIQKHQKVTKYIKPVYTAVVKYEDQVIALERHPMGMMGELEHEGLDGQMRRWKPYSETNLDDIVYPHMQATGRDWFFDGRYAFSFDVNDLDEVVDRGISMTEDSRFRKIACTAIDFQELSSGDKLSPHERSCLAFVTDDFEYTISPPIWKDIESMRASKKDDENSKMPVSFDRMDETMSVNLNYALKAGKEIGAMFGYELIEPLHLPRLMIELHTVNLPNIPKQIKATYCIGMKFTHAMAWTLGMLRRSNTLETYMMVRSLIKYLSKRGIYQNNAFHADQILVENASISDIPLLNMDTIRENVDLDTMTMSAIIAQSRLNKRDRPTGSNNMAGLLIESGD